MVVHKDRYEVVKEGKSAEYDPIEKINNIKSVQEAELQFQPLT